MTDESTMASTESTEPAPESPSPEPIVDKERRGCRELGVVVLVLLVVAGAVLYFAWPKGASKGPSGEATPSAATTSKPIPAGTTAIPNVVGSTLDAALSELEAVGFVPLSTFVETSTARAGDVIAQFPEGGTGLGEGSQVSIAVAAPVKAAGPVPIAVPNVYQMTKAQAQSLLMRSGFAPVFAEGPSIEASGVAVTQYPTAQDSAIPGHAILVLMSNGHQPQTASIAIPSVIGMTEADATQALAKAQLAAQILRGFNPAAKGSVFGQLPPAGGQVAPHTPIVLAASLGTLPANDRPVAVPDVVKMDTAVAYSALSQAGLQMQLAAVTSPELPVGEVVGQLPPAGWSVPAGSIVIVSSGVAK